MTYSHTSLSAQHTDKSMILISIGGTQTDWNLIVAKCGSDINCNIGIDYYVPIAAKDFGLSISASWWYQFTQQLGIRIEFTQLSPSYITFSEDPTTYERERSEPFDKFPLTTHTQIASVFSTFTTHFSNHSWRFITSLGLSLIHRKDELANIYHVGPTFGLDLLYKLKHKLLIGIGIKFSSGQATMNLKPVDTYIPFIYGLKFNIGWQF